MSFNLYLLYMLNSMNCVDGLQIFGYTLKKKPPIPKSKQTNKMLNDHKLTKINLGTAVKLLPT